MVQAVPKKTSADRQLILLIDDDAVVRRSLQLLLRSKGYEVLAYAAGRDVLTDPAARSAACLVTDYLMPDLDGIEILQGLRDTGWTQPAILITAAGSDGLVRRAAERGFDHVLEKPLQPRLMLEAIAKATAQLPSC
jgi:FixJ family two-component response regulator